eukprot:ANDGO_06984.mRNA.1 Protein BUD31 homolog
MPKLSRFRGKQPEGFDKVEATLLEFERRMRAAETESHEGKRRAESTWEITKVHHDRSKYVFDVYKKAEISRELYEWLLKEKFADAALIAKWKKSGYEKLCCLRCIETDKNFGGVCICRVPKSKRSNAEEAIECQTCGCHGCASGDQQ